MVNELVCIKLIDCIYGKEIFSLMEKKDKELDEDLQKEEEVFSEESGDDEEKVLTGEEKDSGGEEKDSGGVIDETADLEKKAADYLDRYRRTLAEFDNFRKRTSKEKASMYDDGVRDSVLKLIPVADNFERAVGAVSDEEKESGLYKGIEMVLKQFTDILASLGVREIEAEGKKFDPNLHNAVMHIEDDKFGENEVCAVLQKGYICRDKVIRPSMVQVAN